MTLIQSKTSVLIYYNEYFFIKTWENTINYLYTQISNFDEKISIISCRKCHFTLFE